MISRFYQKIRWALATDAGQGPEAMPTERSTNHSIFDQMVIERGWPFELHEPDLGV